MTPAEYIFHLGAGFAAGMSIIGAGLLYDAWAYVRERERWLRRHQLAVRRRVYGDPMLGHLALAVRDWCTARRA